MTSSTLGLQKPPSPPRTLDQKIDRWFEKYCSTGYASFSFPPFPASPFNRIQPHLHDCTYVPSLNTCSCILFFLISKFDHPGADEHIVYEWKDTGRWSGEERVRNHDRLRDKEGLVWEFKECVWRENVSDANFNRISRWVMDIPDFPAEPF